METWLERLQHPDPDIRIKHLSALRNTEDVHIIEFLIEMLEQDENLYVRGEAAETLQRIGDDRIVQPFTHALEHDEHWYVRLIAVDVLGTTDTPQALKLLTKSLKDEDSSVRAKAAEVLGEIGNTTGVVVGLINALHDRELTVRERAAEALGKIGDPYSVNALATLLGEKHAHIRTTAAEALASIGAQRSVEILVRELEHAEQQNRDDAARALGTLTRAAAKYLVQFLGTPRKDVRAQLVRILDQLDWKPENDTERTIYTVARTHGKIKTVLFGNLPFVANHYSEILLNPEVAELTLPVSMLTTILVHTATYRFYQVEQFFTYAVNYIGQGYLKKAVEVHIYGSQEQLHPNLLNTFRNVCKTIHLHDDDELSNFIRKIS